MTELWTKVVEEHLGVQRASVPKTYFARVLVESPTLASIPQALEALKKQGVPESAMISFSQWNAPDTNWYINAAWED